MPISVEQAQFASCDACGKQVWARVDDPLPGVIGGLQIHSSWGAAPVEFFSCEVSADHVADAAKRVIRGYIAGDLSNGLPYSEPTIPPFADPEPPEPLSAGPGEPPDDRLPWVALSIPLDVWRTAPAPDDDALLLPFVDNLWSEMGRRPGKDRIKKTCKVGERRAVWLLDAVEAGRTARGLSG